MNNRGFTLVELLTVVSIIGILSAMTLVTFPAARSRAKDGVIMSDMGQLRAEAEVLYGEGTTYANLGGTLISAAWTALVDDITTQHEAPAIEAIAQAYCVTVTLNSTDEWCIDSTGFAGIIAAATDCDGDVDAATCAAGD